jgi:YbbR domain-containing protein
MSNLATTIVRGLINNAPRKLGALLLAVLVWIVVTTDNETIAQRSLLVPIAVDGVSAEAVVVGLPQFAEVAISGPAARVDRLRPENIEAILDLTGVAGDFQVQVVVAPPQGISLERVVPNEVIGIVEAVVRTRVPVIASVMGELGPDLRGRLSVSPESAEVSGRAALVARAAAIAVPIPVSELERGNGLNAAGFVVDANGRPLPDVSIDVGAFSLSWDLEPVWLTKRLPLSLAPLASDRWDDLGGAPESVLVVGLASRVAELEVLVADVELPTGERDEGRYTLVLRPRLPEAVVIAEPVTLSARYTPPPRQLVE